MNAFYSWLRALSHWLREPWSFWLAIVVTGAAMCVALRPGTSEPVIRLTGLFLQLLGVGTVAWGIAETRELFGKPKLVSVAREWLKRVPPFRRPAVTGTSNITLAGDTLHAHGYVTDNAPAGAPVEARVEVLEKNLRRLNERLDRAQNELQEELRGLNAALRHEQSHRASEDEITRRKLEVSETGGIHISAMGVLWLFVGVTLSTASLELSKWLQ